VQVCLIFSVTGHFNFSGYIDFLAMSNYIPKADNLECQFDL
jgi:hypothetical protein